MTKSKVTIYSTQACLYSEKEKVWFEKQGISYKNHWVDKNPLRAQEMIRLSGQMGVPVTVIEEPTEKHRHIVIGFDPKTLARLLIR